MDRYGRPIFAISLKFLIANPELELGLSVIELMVYRFLIANKMQFLHSYKLPKGCGHLPKSISPASQQPIDRAPAHK